MMRSRWQVMMGCLAMAVVGMLVWADQRPGTPAGNPPPQPLVAQLAEGGIAALAELEPVIPVMPATPAFALPAPTVRASEPALSGLRAVDLPADPIIPIPLHHPRADVVGGIYSSIGDVMRHQNPPAPVLTTPPVVVPAQTTECEDTPVTPPPPTVEPPLIRAVVDVSAPVPTATTVATPAVAPFPWRLSMEMVGNLTQIEVCRGDESLVRVQCEALELSTPGGGLVARGKVVVSGPCHEARCDRMTVAWQSGEVALDGGVQLSFRHEGVVQMMRAEALTFRLGGANQPIEFTTRDVQIKVSPKP